ncbi:MAG: trypsin-like peptidase domain-containing protein [Planctomycetes bacterium]|nr:trypsin-like peptidase domain-containing protein [Planctomycetota bacterium]
MQRFLFSRFTLALVLTIGLTFHANPARADGEPYDKLLSSTAWVVTSDGKQFMTGTGCVIDCERKLLVTCLHVVKDHPEASVYFPIYQRRGPVVKDAKEYLVRRSDMIARVVATDSRRDLAILRLDHIPSDVSALELAQDGPKPGQTVYGIGNTGNEGKALEQFSLWKAYESKVTRMVFSTQFMKNTGRTMDTWALELETPIHPGGSGGPLIDGDGKLVGMAYGAHEDKGYSVHFDELRMLLDRLKKPMDVAGEWTVRFSAKDKEPSFMKVNFYEGGTLEWISDKKHLGAFELKDDQLNLMVPGLNIEETVTITRHDETRFTFQSADVLFTFSRR